MREREQITERAQYARDFFLIAAEDWGGKEICTKGAVVGPKEGEG